MKVSKAQFVGLLMFFIGLLEYIWAADDAVACNSLFLGLKYTQCDVHFISDIIFLFNYN